jgi:O-antigen/teichoic acid export membrane protein
VGSPALAAGRTVARNVAGMLLARVALALAGLVSLPVVYDRLGPTQFGIWALLSGLVTMVALVDLGLGSTLVRQVAATVHGGENRRARSALGVALVWGIVLALGAMAATVAVWPWLARLLNFGELAGEARKAALGLLCGLLIDGVAMPWRGVLEGMQRYPAVAWATGGTAVLGAVLAIVIVRLGGGLAALAGSVVATSALRAVLVVLAARRCAASMSPALAGLRRDDLRALGGYGLRVQVTSAAGAVNLELDRFVLSGFFGPSVAGGFDLGGRLVNLLRLPPAFALVALFPMAVSRAAERGPGWLDRFNLVVTRYLTAFAATGAAVLVVCADPLIRLWLGQPMWWAAANVAILAPSYAVNLASGATAIVTRVEGQPGRETGYAVASVVLNLALTWPLLRLFGPPGVPMATAVGVAVSTGYFIWSYHRGTGRPIAPMVRAIWPSLGAAVAGACAGALLAPWLPDGPGRLDAAVAVGCRASIVVLVVAGVLALTGFVGVDDRDRARRFIRRAAARLSVVSGGTR